jgi:hypothetical protein
VLNGISTTTITDVVPAGSTAAPSTATVALVFNNLELPRGTSAYPGSGNIDLTYNTSPTRLGTPLHLQLAFNGTSKVAVMSDMGGIPLPPCTYDLSTTNPRCI